VKRPCCTRLPPALYAEALHAESAREMITPAVLGLLDQLVAGRAQLDQLAFRCLGVEGVQVLLAGEAMVPGGEGQAAEVKVAGGAL